MRLFIDELHFIETDFPLDISIGLKSGNENLSAWYVDPPKFEPVRANGFLGSVAEGGAVNFRNVFFNPHGHGTHTECCGHITKEVHSINQNLKNYFFKATLLTVTPDKLENGDRVIFDYHLNKSIQKDFSEALIIRTLPNGNEKKSMNYADTNPAYLDLSVMKVIKNLDIQHLLIDLPSVDRESDGGKLAFHHAFWNVPSKPDLHKTITELIYVDSTIQDGEYILELQVAPFENDASPSRPILYELHQISG
jgi:kynurenine formamidase